MVELLEFLVELALESWRTLVCGILFCFLGLQLSRFFPEHIVSLSLGGFFVGMLVGFIWHCKRFR
jgi:hypothetical protein